MLIRIFLPWIVLAAILGAAVGGSWVWSLHEPKPYPQGQPTKAEGQHASPGDANTPKGHSSKHDHEGQRKEHWYDTFFDHMPDWFVAIFTAILSVITFLLVRSHQSVVEGRRATTRYY